MPDAIEISRVPPDSLEHVWSQILPDIERGLRHGQGDGTTPAHILAGIREGDFRLWAVHEGEEILAGIIISVPFTATGIKLFVELLAGRDMHRWVDKLESLLDDFRSLLGAQCVEASCRRGLAKKLSQRGWRQKAVIMEAPRHE